MSLHPWMPLQFSAFVALDSVNFGRSSSFGLKSSAPMASWVHCSLMQSFLEFAPVATRWYSGTAGFVEPVGASSIPWVPSRSAFSADAGDRDQDRRAGLGCRDPEHANYWGQAGFWMGSPLDRVIHKLKYESQANLAAGLARCLAGTVPRAGSAVSGILPVPLHRTRLRERGFNQASLLGQGLQRHWGVPVLEGLLHRPRASPPQAHTAQEEREENIAGAFVCNEPKMANSRNWLLVDDVATTGSTLVEAVRALEAVGEVRTRLIVVALA